jgi:GTP:adenosylcobinamide-phosphate guanylyltransferase
MEYIINQGYEYFFVVEDDIIFLDDNIFSDMVQRANEKTLTFINNCKNTRESLHPPTKGKSWRVQLV